MVSTSIQALSSLVLAGAAAATAVAAWVGLHTWRTKMRAGSEHEVARSLLRAALRVRNAIREKRSVFAPPPNVPAAEFEKDRPSASWVAGVQALLQGMREAGTEFDAQVLEAEVLWGERGKKACMPFVRVANRYALAVRQYYRAQADERWKLSEEKWQELDGVVWEASGEDDAFGKQLEEALEELQSFARPYLQVRS